MLLLQKFYCLKDSQREGKSKQENIYRPAHASKLYHNTKAAIYEEKKI